mgnify:CR=1 FL=1|jgi:hypothetical protein
MKTKKVILVSAIALLGVGTLSNLQWSMDKYGLSNGKVILAADTDTGTKADADKKGKKWVKEFGGETQVVQETVEQTTTVKVGPVTKTEKTTYTRPKTLYQNICKDGDKLKTCTPSWDDHQM